MRTGPVSLAKFAAVAALLAAIFLLSPAARAETPGIDKAQKLVDDHKTVVARFMHPASSLDKVLCTKTRRYETGAFYLVYAFYFDGDRFHSSLRFHFFEDGRDNILFLHSLDYHTFPVENGDPFSGGDTDI